MHKFKDSKHREWTISLTIGRAREVLDVTGVDLLQPESGTPSLPEVLADEFKVAAILEILLAGEFRRLGIDPKAVMAEDWDGATSRAAYDAFLEELAAFFEDRGQAPRAAIIRKTREAISTALEIVGEKANALNPAAELRRLALAPPSAAGNTYGRPPDVSASTPAP
jgi:hypothetical protein